MLGGGAIHFEYAVKVAVLWWICSEDSERGGGG